MMSQGGEPVPGPGSNPTEVNYASHAHTSTYPWPTPSHPPPVSWSYPTDNNSTQNQYSSNYYYDPQRDVSIPSNAPSGSNLNPTTQDYSSYTPYPTPPVNYSYNNPTNYQSYYYNYPQVNSTPVNSTSPVNSAPPVNSTPQVAPSQNSGATYNPSFDNSGSSSSTTTTYHVGHTSNFDTHSMNSATGYQQQGTYYYPQTNQSYQYTGYSTADTGGSVQTSTNTTTNTNITSSTTVPSSNSYSYQYQYNQWPPYYYGTESAPVNTVSPYSSGGYSYPPANQPPPPGTTVWRTDSGTPALPPPVQPVQEIRATGYQNQYTGPPPAYPQNPSDQKGNILYSQQHQQQGNILYSQQQQQQQQQGNILYSQQQQQQGNIHYSQQQQHGNPYSQQQQQGNIPYSYPAPNMNHVSSALTNQVPESSVQQLQSQNQVSKLQIQTNPRIAPGPAITASSAAKVDHTAKPAYVTVNKSNATSENMEDSDSIIKGAFPVSLRAYVERTFARCKNDAQRSANHSLMKEVITKASVDGTLFTKNWDLEPLFPLPSTAPDTANLNKTQDSVIFPSLSGKGRRGKSRWEPVAEDKPPEKSDFSANNFKNNAINNDNDIILNINNSSGKDPASQGRLDSSAQRTDSKNWNFVKFISAQKPSPFDKTPHTPASKKQKTGGPRKNLMESSSDSDEMEEKGLTKYYSSAISLASSAEERKKREHRSKRFDNKKRDQNSAPNSNSDTSGSSVYLRKASALLVAKSYEDGSNNNYNNRAVEDIDWDALTVKGTCQEIEKRYLRLTSAPDPSTVRPEDVLEKALNMVQTSNKNYLYKCDQLKSIRQDLTVQRIQNELTVRVYETHARLALQAGDLPEFNQCQSQLKRLYGEGIKGCQPEFSAYNLLCVILHSNNKRDLLSSMASLSLDAKKDEAVKHALSVRSAVSSGNYILFFRLYRTAHNLHTCLMDPYVERMRFEAVKCMCKAYRPTVPVKYVARVLGFVQDSNGDEMEGKAATSNGVEECGEWLRSHGAVLLSPDNNGELQLDTKASSATLYMPEPENAVAHGDASLAVDDFLARAP